jgi:hypothetical protein
MANFMRKMEGWRTMERRAFLQKEVLVCSYLLNKTQNPNQLLKHPIIKKVDWHNTKVFGNFNSNLQKMLPVLNLI